MKNRMDSLYTTGVPRRSHCVIAREVQGRPAREAEEALHATLFSYCPNHAREFFEIHPDDAKRLVLKIPGTPAAPSPQREFGLFSYTDNPNCTRRLPMDILSRLAHALDQELLLRTAERVASQAQSLQQGFLPRWGGCLLKFEHGHASKYRSRREHTVDLQHH